MVNSKENKLIHLYTCMGCFNGSEFDKEILTLIEPANAVFEIDRMPFIDIEIYGQFILSRLKSLRKKAEEENTYAKAYEYVCAANDYINDCRRSHELLFQSTPIPADFKSPENSKKENPDKE
ncbi:MAG: hypothetical protein J7K40_15390 [candidate division Zixibacteria bacterium]|nr:hypothetical protein [candidate division Zixibacteria bacterium]